MTVKGTLDLIRNEKIFVNTDKADAQIITIMALNKQIALKPKTERNKHGLPDLTYKVCPSCGSIYIYNADNQKANFCNDCGQKIDWS